MNYDAFKNELRRQTRQALTHPNERCPDSDTLASYVTGELDEETKRHVGVHVALCKNCFQEMSALEAIERESHWGQLAQALKTFCIDLYKTYGRGTLLGSIRIVEEAPAFATRGEITPEQIFKVLEVSIGSNVYSIQLTVTGDGSISCDVAGQEMRRPTPMEITVHSETGQQLFVARTDDHGNSSSVIPSAAVADMPHIVVTFTLDGEKNQVLIALPDKRAAG